MGKKQPVEVDMLEEFAERLRAQHRRRRRLWSPRDIGTVPSIFAPGEIERLLKEAAGK